MMSITAGYCDVCLVSVNEMKWMNEMKNTLLIPDGKFNIVVIIIIIIIKITALLFIIVIVIVITIIIIIIMN